GGLGDRIEESKGPRTALLLLEQVGILDRYCYLPSGSLQEFHVTLGVHVITLVVQGGHDANGLALHEDRYAAERFRGSSGNERCADALTHLFHLRKDKQWLSGADYVFAQTVGQLTGAFGLNFPFDHLQLEPQLDLIRESDVEGMCVDEQANL